MIVTAPFQHDSSSPIRPVNLGKDLPQVINLLRITFGEMVDENGRRMLFNTPSTIQPAFLWRLSPFGQKLGNGFVWEESGRIVGNVTLIASKINGRYLIVNVAVHPNFRRRGIARQLMHTVTQYVRQKNGQELLLQVVKSNTAALELYKSLNYTNLGSMTTWLSSVSRIRSLLTGQETGSPRIRELRRNEWRTAYQFDRACLPADLNWPEPLATDAYKTGFGRRVANFFNGRHLESWVITNRQNQLQALGSLITEWGRLHQLAVRIQPAHRVALARPMLAKLLRRLSYLSRRRVRIDHPDDDEIMNDLLREANFSPRRTLTHMRLRLK